MYDFLFNVNGNLYHICQHLRDNREWTSEIMQIQNLNSKQKAKAWATTTPITLVDGKLNAPQFDFKKSRIYLK